MSEGDASVFVDNEQRPALSATEQRRERARQRRRERPPEAVAADAARAHAAYLRRLEGMTPADREAVRARARARYHGQSPEERAYLRESRRAAAAARAARASVAEKVDDAERREARADVFRRRRARLRDAAEQELLSEEAAARLEAEHIVGPLDKGLVDSMYQECQQRLGWEGMGEAVCGVCQLLVPAASTVALPPSAWPLAAMATRLRPADDLPTELVKQYDLSSTFPLSGNMLLSPLGVVRGAAEEDVAARVGGTGGTEVGTSGRGGDTSGRNDSTRSAPGENGTLAAMTFHDVTSTANAAASAAASAAESGCGAPVASGVSEPALTFCGTCLASLERPNRNGNPPRLALANGNATGRLPDNLRDSTSTEFNLVSTVSVRAAVTFLRGGGQAALRAHTLLIDTRPTPPAAKLPRVLGNSDTDGVFRVVFASRLSTAQEVAARRTFLVRRRRVTELLEWLQANNHLYANVAIETAAVNGLPGAEGGEVPEGLFIDAHDADGRSPAPPVAEREASPLLPRAVVPGDESTPQTESCDVEVVPNASVVVQGDQRTDAQRVEDALQGTIRVKRTGPVMRDGENGAVEAAFVRSFPFGRGGPSEKRKVHLAEAEVMRRLMMDGYREFGRNQLLLVYAFDRAARVKMLRKGYLRLQRSPEDIGHVSHVTEEELRRQVLRDERRKRKRAAGIFTQGGDSSDDGAGGDGHGGRPARKRSRHDFRAGSRHAAEHGPQPSPRQHGSANSRSRVGDRRARTLLRVVSAAAGAYDGPNEQRKGYRQEAYAMCNHFGLPQLFFTFSPNDVGSATLWYYAGAVDRDIFSSFNVGHLLSKSDRFRTLARDPVAGARYFRRLAHVVVEVLIGWNELCGRPRAQGGAFGTCKGFYGAIEAQARGSPHIHMLIWLYGHAPSAQEFVKMVRDDEQFRKRWWAWAEDLVHADLPTSTEGIECPECSGSVASVAIPRSFHGVPPQSAVPPAVAACQVPTCGKRLTSADVLEQQQARAAGVWRVAGNTADGEDVAKAGEEAAVVGAKQGGGGEAREPLIGAETLDVLMATPVLPAWSAAAGHSQYGHVYEASIAMATQMHSHRHAPSCFKRTRTGRPRECRYGFPREPRKDAEVEDEGGFLARRPVGCEYVNPHVRLVLLTARCNSDVRVLQATDVVMYTVKYALKPMADDERDAIQMLHRFQRVLSAEQVELPRTELGKATRRVCALAYAATERQEMPATLAAIFLLYKDGNIASHPFVPLVMPQLLAFHEGAAAATAVVPVARTRDEAASGRGDTEDEAGSCGVLASDACAKDADAVLGEDLVPVDSDESQRADGPQLFVLMSQTLDYRLRPRELSHLSPYEMYEQYEKRRIPRHVSSQRKRGAASRTGERLDQDEAEAASDEVGTAEGGGCETPADDFMLAGDRGRRRGGAATGAHLGLFLRDHPQHKTHHLVRCDPQRVPRIVGPRLPDRHKLDDDADARELYGAFALVVFMPWRARGDLRPDTDTSWWAAFESTELTSYAVRKLQTFQSWHDGCAKPKQREPSTEEGEADGDSDVGDCKSSAEASEISKAVSVDPEAGQAGDINDSPPLDFVGCLAVDDGGVEMLPPRGRVCMAAERAGVIGVVARAHSSGTAAKCGLLTDDGGAPPAWSSEGEAEPLLARVAMAARGAIIGGVAASAKELDFELQAACQARRTCEQDALRDAASPGDVGGDEASAGGFGDNPPEVTVERLQALHVDALGLKSSDCGATVPVLEASAGLSPHTAPMPGLDASIVAAVFTLNAEQRRAFGACAATLSAQWAKGLRNLEALDVGAATSLTLRRGVADQLVDTVGDGQLLMYLGGTAGSGKSRVIDAVRYFAHSWARARSVTCAAPTGVAASNIDGSTLHTLLKLSLGGTTKKAPQSLVEFFTGVVLVIIDELSMISADFLAIIEYRLRQVGDAGAVFGGFSVVLGGDLQQLPPVVSTPLWTAGPAPVRGAKAEEERHVRRMRGVQLWRMFRTVVFLRQNMRQGHDPGFASLCDRLRDGTTTRADVDNINLHCLVSSKSPVALPLTGVDLFCPMIVATNAVRIQVTQSVMRQCSRQLPASNKPVRHYPIVRIVKRAAEAVDRRLLAAAVEALPPSRTDNRDMVLEAFDGALLMVEQNVATEAGVANGSLVRLLCVHYPPGTTFSDVAVAGGGVMRVASDHADVLYVLPLQQPRAWRRLAGIPHWLPDETVPIVRKEARFSLKVDDVSVSVSALQFPVTPAFAMTTYKVQGKTTDAIILLEWSKLFVWCVAFVVFTRVRKMSNLFIGAPLSWEMAERCKPPPELLVELSRLRALEAAMLASGSGVLAPATLPVGGADSAGGSARRGLMADSILVGKISACASSLRPLAGSAGRAFVGPALIAAAAVVLLAARTRVSISDVLHVVMCVNSWWWATLSSSCLSGPHMTPDDATASDDATSAAEAADLAVWPEARTGELHFVDAPPLASAVANADGLLAPVKQPAAALVATCLGQGAVGSGSASVCEDDLLVYGPGNERITRRVLRRFAPGQWLSDENVNSVLSMLQVRNDEDVAAGRAVPVCLFLNSFFFDKLMSGRHREYNFEAVRRWTARRDLRAVDLVMTVVKHGGGHGNHWTLAVVHTSTGTVEHFDSLGAHHPAVVSSLSRWYQDAVRSGGGRPPRPAPSIDHGAGAPQQRNGDDCGVFAVAVASALSRREPVGQVTAARTVYFRLRFAAELLVRGRHSRGFLSTSSVE